MRFIEDDGVEVELRIYGLFRQRIGLARTDVGDYTDDPKHIVRRLEEHGAKQTARIEDLEKRLEDLAYENALAQCAIYELYELSDFDGGRFRVTFCVSGDGKDYHLFNSLEEIRDSKEKP